VEGSADLDQGGPKDLDVEGERLEVGIGGQLLEPADQQAVVRPLVELRLLQLEV
jgi:hypothetical protein